MPLGFSGFARMLSTSATTCSESPEGRVFRRLGIEVKILRIVLARELDDLGFLERPARGYETFADLPVLKVPVTHRRGLGPPGRLRLPTRANGSLARELRR